MNNAITIHRAQHDATVPTGPADLALPFATALVGLPTAATATRAPELPSAPARAGRNRRRRAAAARRRSAA